MKPERQRPSGVLSGIWVPMLNVFLLLDFRVIEIEVDAKRCEGEEQLFRLFRPVLLF